MKASVQHASSCCAGEQIGRFNGPRSKRWLKMEARRKERQAARRLGEDAPTKRRYAGWGD